MNSGFQGKMQEHFADVEAFLHDLWLKDGFILQDIRRITSLINDGDNRFRFETKIIAER